MSERTDKALARQFRTAHDAAVAAVPLEQPTKDEARNGWTAETLAAYRVEQLAAQQLKIDPHGSLRKARPIMQAGRKLGWAR